MKWQGRPKSKNVQDVAVRDFIKDKKKKQKAKTNIVDVTNSLDKLAMSARKGMKAAVAKSVPKSAKEAMGAGHITGNRLKLRKPPKKPIPPSEPKAKPSLTGRRSPIPPNPRGVKKTKPSLTGRRSPKA